MTIKVRTYLRKSYLSLYKYLHAFLLAMLCATGTPSSAITVEMDITAELKPDSARP